MSVNRWLNLLLFVVGIGLIGCDNDDTASSIANLQDYLTTQQANMPASVGLVACAAGNLSLDDLPLTVFYRTKTGGISDLRYFESASVDIDPLDYNNYEEVSIENQSLFNGFMGKFELPEPQTEKWSIVTYVANDTLWYCEPIKMESLTKPTAMPSGLITVNMDTPLNPIFYWTDEADTENVIYYQLIVDPNTNEAISGTYTTDLQWQFYDLSNVVFNVTEPGTEPELVPNQIYKMIMMGVSEDNWVNLFGEFEFITI